MPKKTLFLVFLITALLCIVLDTGKYILPDSSIKTVYAPRETVPIPTKPSKDKININTATHEALDSLYGIGTVFADRIIKYRSEKGPFETTADIMKVTAFGEKRYLKIKDNITVKEE